MLHFLMFAAGLAALVVGANLLVRGASRLALSFGISPLVVGLTIVAFGTSAPEMAVSTGAVLNGQTGLAMGNVVGSNIFNVLFILGLSALIAPLVVHVQIIRQEVPILMGASLLLLVLGLDGRISLTDGALLFGLLLAYTVFLVVQSRRETQAAQAEFEAEIHAPAAGAWDARLPAQIALIVAGLALLVLGSDWLVGAAVVFAKALGVSDGTRPLGHAGADADAGASKTDPGGSNVIAVNHQGAKSLASQVLGRRAEVQLPLADDGVHDDGVPFHGDVGYGPARSLTVASVPFDRAFGGAFLDDLGDAVLFIDQRENAAAEQSSVSLGDLFRLENLHHDDIPWFG